MPNSVVEIENSLSFTSSSGAFAFNNITYLALSQNLKHIGHYAFYENKNLEKIIIPDYVSIVDFCSGK